MSDMLKTLNENNMSRRLMREGLRALREQSNLERLKSLNIPFGDPEPYSGDLPNQDYLTYSPTTLYKRLEKEGIKQLPPRPKDFSRDQGPLQYDMENRGEKINPVLRPGDIGFVTRHPNVTKLMRKYRQYDV